MPEQCYIDMAKDWCSVNMSEDVDDDTYEAKVLEVALEFEEMYESE